MPLSPLTPAYEAKRLTELAGALALKSRMRSRDS
jgi:hypothetical protein